METRDIQDVREILSRGLEEYGLTGRADPRAAQNLSAYCRFLLDKNRVMDLTAITDPADAANLHMLDCAALLNCADFEDKSLIDVGTGAGFPGVVLKLLIPSLELTLLDAQNKRLNFLREVCGELGIRGARTVHGRGEELGLEPEFRGRFDFATARAVADLRLLCELCLPFVKVGGRFLAMKSVGSDEEIQAARPAIQILGGRVERCFDYTIPGTDVTHRVVVVEKTATTPPKYPRRWAKMQKMPL